MLDAVNLQPALHDQLIDRQNTLQRAVSQDGANVEFARLLSEVDAALHRFDQGTYGICETCKDPIEPERLLADPLTTFCIDHLTAKQQRALESDLELAARIQHRLLPEAGFKGSSWQVDFVYEPAGIVSGDYCDVITSSGESYFILADVSGKGMAASLLMSNLHAMFHSLIPLGLPLAELMERANRIFSENTLANHFATLICIKANDNGEIEFSNAGHLPPVLLRRDGRDVLNMSDLPLGMFADVCFETHKLSLDDGDSLLLYTDGVTETNDINGVEFGMEGLLGSLHDGDELKDLLQNCGDAVASFRGDVTRGDDLTLMALRFSAAAGKGLAVNI
jgi:sigma-B regulation protein RsbU (phosphoserine phosphatase)